MRHYSLSLFLLALVVCVTVVVATSADVSEASVPSDAWNELLQAAAPVESVSNLRNHVRIVGGSVVTSLTKYPMMVSFQINQAPFCGGTLIASQVVLTAAHCFTPGQSTSNISAVVGRIDVKATTGQTRSITGFVRHPSYVGSDSDQSNDIALVYLSSPVTCDSTVATAVLNTDSFPTSTNVTPIGFGYTSNPQTTTPMTSQYLKEVTLQVANCPTVSSGDFCMLATVGNDSCNGDSGGPVLAANNVLVGVTSRGPAACGAQLAYSINTRVSSYISWIQSQITASPQTGSYSGTAPSSTCVSANGNNPNANGTGTTTGSGNSVAVPSVVVLLLAALLSILVL